MTATSAIIITAATTEVTITGDEDVFSFDSFIFSSLLGFSSIIEGEFTLPSYSFDVFLSKIES